MAADRLGPLFEKMRRTMEEATEKRRAEILARPPVDPNDVLVRDPNTGKRKVFSGVTLHQEHHIRFRVMTHGDLMSVPEDVRYSKDKVIVLDWPDESKATILQSCLVEPDLVGACEAAGEEFGVAWLRDNVVWPIVDDYVECICRMSQPKLQSVVFEEEEKKGPGPQAEGSENESVNSDSMSSDTDTPTEVSIA